MSCRGGTERDGMMDRRNGERRNVYRMAREATPNNPSSRSSGPATSSFAPSSVHYVIWPSQTSPMSSCTLGEMRRATTVVTSNLMQEKRWWLKNYRSITRKLMALLI